MSMKIYVDNKEQKDNILRILTESSYCPEDFDLKDIKGEECVSTFENCEKCWRNSGLEIVVGDENKPSNPLSDLELFAKMMGQAIDSHGRDKFEKRNDILENRCRHLRLFIENEIGLTEDIIERAFDKGYFTFNDKRFLLDLPELGDPNDLGEKEIKSLDEWCSKC